MLVSIEFNKLKRTRLLLISVITIVLVAFIIVLQGLRYFQGERYINTLGWLSEGTLSLFTYYIFPPLFALIGSFIICRELQYDTLKNLQMIPISKTKLMLVKLCTACLISLLMSVVLFMVVICTEYIFNGRMMTINFVITNFKQYLLQGIGCFVAVTPIITIATVLSRGYWISAAIAIVYSFIGVFTTNSPIHSLYPISAIFEVSGARTVAAGEYVIAVGSLSGALLLSLIFIGLPFKREGE
ncbi:ABC transporter permease [Paenibacillus sp. FSL R7-0652]|uniref:ABC transporter permease n=1 Tax=Paenibacillus sp. AN1007 TaxID=3151385 RepID=A0AAU8NJL0_9BACL